MSRLSEALEHLQQFTRASLTDRIATLEIALENADQTTCSTFLESEAVKRKCLYVLDLALQLRFLHGRRALESVMSKNLKLAGDFRRMYGDRFSTVRDYFLFRREAVHLEDVTPLLKELAPPEGILAEII